MMKIPKNTLHAAEAKLMGAAGAACERASFRECRHAGMWLGLLFHHALPSRRKISRDNLRLAFPRLNEKQADRIARRVSQNAAMTFCEFLHLRAASENELREYSWIEGYEHVQSGFDAGRGVLLLTGHLGNWEMMGARAALEFPLTVIARPRSNEAVHNHIESIRTKVNVQVISRFDTGRGPLKVLRSNQALAILPDQYEKGGVMLPFFNHQTQMVDALARLAILSRARVVPAFGVRRTPWLSDGRIVAQVFPGFDIPKTEKRDEDVLNGTRRVVQELEHIIRAHPDQWLWMHRRWREKDLLGIGN
jgi:KDO2-lipid IV(A) lauroyltransferase